MTCAASSGAYVVPVTSPSMRSAASQVSRFPCVVQIRRQKIYTVNFRCQPRCSIFSTMTTGNRRGRPGRRAILDAEQVIDAALAILDADGLEGVSFRRLSADLGVSHMTLYGYFDSKEALLEALVARTLAVPSIRRASTAPWDGVLFDAI